MNEAHAKALELAEGLVASATNISKVASICGAEAARWAFTQWELRTRARQKFDRAESMLFDRDGYEMSSHELVAAYHATCFPSGVLVADLTVGIGADLIALGRRGQTIGFELSQERATMAESNLRVHGVNAPIVVADCLAGPWEFEYAFADPARRVGDRKRVEPSDYEPNLNELVARMSGLRLGIIKLSPLVPDETLQSFGGTFRFLSYGGECREALLIVGKDVDGMAPCAVHLESGATVGAGREAIETPLPGKYLYEADPAGIRVGGLGTLCETYSLQLVGDSNGYLTGDDRIGSPWLKCYEVLYSGAADIAETRRQLVKHGSATPDVKTRGKGLEAESLRKQWRLGGDERLLVAVYRVGPKIKHVVLRRS